MRLLLLAPLLFLFTACTAGGSLGQTGIYTCTWDRTPGEFYHFDSGADSTDVRYPLIGAEATIRFIDLCRGRAYVASESAGWWCGDHEVKLEDPTCDS